MKFDRNRKYYSAMASRKDITAGGDIAVGGFDWYRSRLCAIIAAMMDGIGLFGYFGFTLEVEVKTAEKIAEQRLLGRKFAQLV